MTAQTNLLPNTPVHLANNGMTEIRLARGGDPGVERPIVWLAEPDSVITHCTRGGKVAIFEGILFNREDLLAEFRWARQFPAADGPIDAELLLHAYSRWGEAAVGHIKGIFSLCIWDATAGTLFCARDPLGQYPFFYADTPLGLFMSTSIAALAGHPSVPATLNRPVLAEYLLYQWSNCHETCYEAIRRLPPGYAMSFGPGGRRIRRHWDPVPADRPVEWILRDELPQFEALLEQAVTRCLRLGPTGILLSGGLDSVTIAVVAAAINRRLGLPAPWAFSLTFPDPACNEEHLQRQVATALGLPQVLLPLKDTVGPKGSLLTLVETARDWPHPTWLMWRPAFRRLAEEARARGCQILLSGTGGDDWLEVDSILAADLLGRMKLASLFRLVASLYRSKGTTLSRLLRQVLWADGARPWFRYAYIRGARALLPGLVEKRRGRMVAAALPPWIAPDRELRGAIVERFVANIRDLDPRPDGFAMTERRHDLNHQAIAIAAEDSFEDDRRTGVPDLKPLMDPELVGFLCRVPPDRLSRGGRNRAFLREPLAQRFPGLGFDGQKKVRADSYHTRIILREGREAWNQMGGAPALADAGVLEGRAFMQEVKDILSGQKGGEAQPIVAVLSLEAWVRPRI